MNRRNTTAIFSRNALRDISFSLVALAASALIAATAQAQVRLEAEAFAGEPFGVGRITLSSGGEFRVNRVPRPGGGRIAQLAKKVIDQAGSGNRETVNLESAEMALIEKAGRTFYPVFEKRERPILKQFVNTPSASTIYFLFQGAAPLDVTAYVPNAQAMQIVPRQDRAGYDRLLSAWWRDYSAAADGRNAVKEYPPMVEEYLTDTLARRLRLPLDQRPAKSETSLLQSELNSLFETETARLEWAQAILLGDVAHEPASELLPEELPEPKPELLNPPGADTPIEPIATKVPVECLYVRFGNFANFLWLRHRMDDWGGELRDIISERGLDFGLNDRFQRQLGLRESALAEVLGERVIADVAIIGTDVFVREGAAMGMLFHAKNSAALTADLTQQRLTALKESKGGKQETISIAGRKVSLVSTPDGALRSFYVAAGDFHLVTTSRALIERFLETADGKHESLAESDEFRITRVNVPLDEQDTIFAYLSPQFFQNLLSPRYQIELDRRLRSAVEMELVQIAQLAARSEHKPGGTIEELVASDLLPAGFGTRPDGSRLELIDGVATDSVRGHRGAFLPAPDVEIGKVTAAEAVAYRDFSRDYTASWGSMDPLVARIRRQALPDGKFERVSVDIQAAPLAKKHVDMLSKWLGEPTDQRLASVPGNAVQFEAVVRGGTFFSGGEHHLFGALRDADPAIALEPGANLIARLFTSQFQGLQGYLGAWPNPGFLRLIGGASNAQPDAAGYSQLLTGLWRRQFNDFTLVSFHSQILEQISPQLRFEKAPRPAQVWLRADDLFNSQLAGLLNAYGYRQAKQVTAGNARFMNMLSEQLHVPKPECLATGERLLGAKFVSPLGGKYELREFDGGLQNWVSTALADSKNGDQPPADYQFPALNWLRGIDAELAVQDGRLAAHANVVMPAETRPAAFQLPSLPTLPFGNGKAAAAPATTNAKPKPGPPAAPKPSPPSAAPKATAPRPGAPAPGDVKRPGPRQF